MISIGNLQINKLFLGNLEVAKAYLGDVEVYGLNKKYMTMTVLDGDAGTTIAPTVTGSLTPNIQYRINNGSWTDFIVGTTADIHAVAGDVVQFKGVNETGISTSDKNYLKFSISGNPVSLSGNVMSLIDGVGDALVIPNNYCFYKMFSQSNVKTVSLDFLPATTLTTWCYSDLFSESLLENAPELPALIMQEQCYRGMFYGCQNLTQATALPSTTLAPFCYQGMFQNCTALTTAPALPAMTMKERCYSYMFSHCSSLLQAPKLPATTLANYCYYSMLDGCTSIETAPELPATTLAPYCYAFMFYGDSSIVNSPELPATIMVSSCYRSMFYNCTALTQAPVLPATTLADYCYAFMFYGCTSLTQAPDLPATELAQYCYNQMFIGCTSLTQAPELPATTLVAYCYQFMFYNCSNLSYVKSLATDITATNALNQWLSGVASSGTFVKPAGVTYPSGASGIPSGWTVVEEKPYMTMTVDKSAGATTITPTLNGNFSTKPKLQYRVNEGAWNDYVFGTTSDIHAVAGDVVQFKGNNPSGISKMNSKYLNFAISDNVHLSGNIMSLIYGEDFIDKTTIPSIYCFYCLFKGSNIKTVSSDFLPATTLKSNCYREMFSDCTALVNAPELPATTLATSCYSGMFQGCTSLTAAPALPATTLAGSCYTSMFDGCTSLATAPALPATTLYSGCYNGMFKYCRSLVTAPEILPATTLEPNCYISMFQGCTSLTTAPALPATTLVDNCYHDMFLVCSNINYVKCLATDISASNALTNWLQQVSPTGTFVKPAGVSYPIGDSGIPSGWTIEEI